MVGRSECSGGGGGGGGGKSGSGGDGWLHVGSVEVVVSPHRGRLGESLWL